MKTLFPFILISLLTACGAKGKTHSGQDVIASKAQNDVIVSAARIVPPFPSKDVAVAYFELKNNGPDNRLISVSTSLSEAAEIHNNVEENGVMKMRRVDGVDLKSGSKVMFKPGGYHIMIFKADVPESLDEAALTLTYSDGVSVTVIAPIEGRESNMGEHSGH